MDLKLEPVRNWLRNSILLRVLFIGFIILILQIPLSMIDSQIYQRSATRNDAVRDISSKWGGQQDITGPRLIIPYKVPYSWEDKQGKKYSSTRTEYAVVLPDTLSITANARNETRYRGIFEVPVYQASINLQGTFNTRILNDWNVDKQLVQWDRTELVMGISDTSALQKQVALRWNSESHVFEPGRGRTDHELPGLHVEKLKIGTDQEFKFNIALELNGSHSLQFAPMARNTSVELQSDWADPSFQGFKLPNHRDVTTEGFQARWSISHISRNYPQIWCHEMDFEPKINQSLVGVIFMTPVDNYRMTERSIKYVVLFLVLTFTTIWLFEIFYKVRVHFLQYLFIGLGMSLFYLLLLAFSEHISFSWSYLMAATAVVVMTGLYSKAVLKSAKRATMIAGGMVLLYGYLYSLLKEQNYSLLSGSIGVFLTLAVVMYVTRNIDWYNLSRRSN